MTSSSKWLKELEPWEYQLAPGFIVRGVRSKPSGKPVLHFVHGNGFCGLTYEVMLSYLQSDVDIFISDAQGHGDSDEGGDHPGWDASSKQLEEVWRHYSKDYGRVPKIACGHSYGAVMSTLIMARRPDLFDFGLLLDPTYAPPFLANGMSALSSVGLMKFTPLSRQARIRSTQWPNAEALWDYFYQRGVFKGWQDECLQSYLDHAVERVKGGSFELKCPPHIEADIFASYARGLWPAIDKIKNKMTMYYGRKTFNFILNSRSRIRSRSSYFDFVEMPGGHCFMQQNPEATATELRRKIRMQIHG